MNARTDSFAPGLADAQVAVLRTPPHSIEAESSVLGGLLLNNRAWEKVCDLLTDGDFYRLEHRLIFAAVGSLLNADREADIVTVFVELQKRGTAEQAGGLAYLNSLAQYTPSAANMRRYAEVVRERAILRRLVVVSDEIATKAFNPDGSSVAAILDEAEQKILTVGKTRGSDSGWVGAFEGMVAHGAVLERRAAGELAAWATGLPDLDEYLEGGLRPGELVIVGARPSMGKTALGLSIGVNMARDRGVGLLSMEMSHLEVNDRLTAMLGHVSLSAVKRPTKGDGLQWDRVVEGIDRARDLRLHVSDQGGLNINQVRTKARNLKRSSGIDVLIVDYIGLMSGLNPKDNRNTQLGEISRGLKSLAKELEISVLCLAQLNRNAEERPDQMPQMSNLRDSGEIEQEADVVMMLHPEPRPEEGQRPKCESITLLIEKQRNGPTGEVKLDYVRPFTEFRNQMPGM